MEFPTDQSYIHHVPDMAHVSHETLYHHVYRDKEAGATFQATCASQPTPTVTRFAGSAGAGLGIR